jgi:pre-mRNA-processing factor 40
MLSHTILKEAKKTMPVAGKINVMPLEEKASEEEPVVYANKLVRMTR